MDTRFQISAIVLSLALVIPTFGYAASYYVDNDREKENGRDTVYTLSNDVNKNEVISFQRNAKGEMLRLGRFATGGTGTGGGLGNQGALAFSKNGDYLFAVNPGSNTLSVFSVGKNGKLKLIDVAANNGLRPVSVTVDKNRVFVVNAGDDTIFGYKFNRRAGKLEPLPLTHKRLSGSRTAPAQISFDNEGEVLVVTEKATNKITTFAIDEDSNLPADGISFDSVGDTPFGFAFNKRNQLIISEANGGRAGESSVSAYKVRDEGLLQLLSSAGAPGQAAACWIVTTPSGRIAYTTNTASGTVSSFTVNANGTLKLLQVVAAREAGATDMAMSNDGKTLYVLAPGSNSVGEYSVDRNGALTKTSTLPGLAAGVTGLLER